jgi:hypothetical protein
MVLKTFSINVLLLVSLQSCHKDGTCGIGKRVDFRGVKFDFPIKALTVMNAKHGTIHYYRGDLIRIDSILPGTTSSWYMEHADNEYESHDSSNFLRTAQIYGVTFLLNSEIKRKDQEILAEIQTKYPGNYKHIYQNGNEYYLNHQECLSILFTRELYDEGRIPAISFLYGLSEKQEQYYANQIGNNSHFD